MNIMTVKHLGAALILIGALAGCNSSKTPDAASSASVPTDQAQVAATVAAEPAPAPTQAPEAEAPPMQIPDTADGIWLAIDKQSSELKAAIQGNSLKDVHHMAFAIRDLVAALPAHSPTLPADEQAKLQGEMKFVATLADRLDATGDAKDQAGAQANYDKLVTVLNGITRTK